MATRGSVVIMSKVSEGSTSAPGSDDGEDSDDRKSPGLSMEDLS
eukprot:CAMPEP_0119515490 /NCGR_PEP_ID=MMETSP1344-20130328/32971_1 /TAXON_ID=236787 /ORGANISM="Florenciella parvula, Strain CCMP2471" /LENGTH=43 /DNA_ID= /DNA_START= /DNA_END= /DNA_ORIENTATION=